MFMKSLKLQYESEIAKAKDNIEPAVTVSAEKEKITAGSKNKDSNNNVNNSSENKVEESKVESNTEEA